MSTIETKLAHSENVAAFPTINVSNGEIDLLGLISTVFAAKKQIIIITLLFALCGIGISFLLPQKWTSRAVIAPPDTEEVISLRRALVHLSVLGVDKEIDMTQLYNLFLKKFDSQELREKFLKNTAYVQALVNDDEVDQSGLYRAIVNVSDKFTAVDNNGPKNTKNAPYASWTLGFTAPNTKDAQQVLQGYVQFLINEVNKDVIADVKNALELSTAFEKEKLALDRKNLENQHKINIERLGYSLQVANAAGLKDPVYSNGQAVKDDPDYAISLGAKGLAEKLKIEQSINDVAQLNASIQQREHRVLEMQGVDLSAIDFMPVKFQMQPSLALKKDGPGKALIVVLAALMGFIIATAWVVIREAMNSRLHIEKL